ncbi:MAG: MFS transporter [Candidatus Limnocylindrales bacterium]
MWVICRIDFRGAILASAATISLLLGLTFAGQGSAWTSPEVAGWIAAGVVLFVLFFIAERFATDPVLPLSLFRNQIFLSAGILSIGAGAVILSLAYYLPLFMQGVLGASATNSGEVITPLTVSMVITGGMSGFLVARTGRYQLLTMGAAALMSVGIFLLSRMTESTSLTQAAVFMVGAGLGLGVFLSTLTLVVQNAVPYTMLGVATGASRYLQQAGATLGIAMVGTVVNNTVSGDISAHLPAGAQQLPAQALSAATNPQVLTNPAYRDQVVSNAVKYGGPGAQQLLDQIFTALRHSLAIGVQDGLVVVLVFGLGMLATTFFLKDVPLRAGWGEQPADGKTASAASGWGETGQG